mgnify:CR=1 FL=1
MISFTATYEPENDEKIVIYQSLDVTPKVIDNELLFNLQRFAASLISLQNNIDIRYYNVKIIDIRVIR